MTSPSSFNENECPDGTNRAQFFLLFFLFTPSHAMYMHKPSLPPHRASGLFAQILKTPRRCLKHLKSPNSSTPLRAGFIHVVAAQGVQRLAVLQQPLVPDDDGDEDHEVPELVAGEEEVEAVGEDGLAWRGDGEGIGC